jgi:hypothetical protein
VIALSPILLVCVRREVVVQIADGYHRTCAAFLTDEDSLVPGRLLMLGPGGTGPLSPPG